MGGRTVPREGRWQTYVRTVSIQPGGWLLSTRPPPVVAFPPRSISATTYPYLLEARDAAWECGNYVIVAKHEDADLAYPCMGPGWLKA